MKSTRSRSRSKNNRNRQNQNQGGNVVNRVFDSSGPEGKVRGTPGQVIEKYNQLARDAQLSNDRVAMENFQQHAEHYLRLLAEAQKEMDTKREEQERQNRERQAERDRERSERQEREGNNQNNNNNNNQQGGGADHHQGGQQSAGENDPQPTENRAHGNEQPVAKLARKPRKPKSEAADQLPGFVTGNSDDDNDSGLVETPESKPKPKRAPRRKPRKPDNGEDGDGSGSQPEAAE